MRVDNTVRSEHQQDGHHEHTHGEGHEHKHDEHTHGEGHEHEHDDHAHGSGIFGWLFHGHKHEGAQVDSALEASAEGIRALKVSLIGLLATAIFQSGIAWISGSAALLADTVHNFSDALTALPLWLAFVVGRRPANKRYTYGYGRAEDLAGLVIVVMITLSAALAGYESIRKLFQPEPVRSLGWVIAAAIIGAIGNEVVAAYRMRTGRRIGSAALIADGQHARVDGLTSLAVLLGAAGVWLGFPMADPLVGLLITVAILLILKDTALTMWHRLMDAVDPALTAHVEQVAAAVEGVHSAHDVRVRWIGHRLRCELHIGVDAALSTADSHALAEETRHRLLHELPGLEVVTVHVDPVGPEDYHAAVSHHEAEQAHDH
ncbi:MAG TPA: cation diffusion facilitator family transporter [Herpetosiphonaceae bacterium]